MIIPICEVVAKLIGPIIPIGSTEEDSSRYANLLETINLIEKLLDDVRYVAHEKHNHAASIKKIGMKADDFIRELQGPR